MVTSSNQASLLTASNVRDHDGMDFDELQDILCFVSLLSPRAPEKARDGTQ